MCDTCAFDYMHVTVIQQVIWYVYFEYGVVYSSCYGNYMREIDYTLSGLFELFFPTMLAIIL